MFDTETSEWHAFDSLQRFRHGCWIQDKQLMIYGGFELSTPNIPTDSIFRVSLPKLYESNPSLTSKLRALDIETTSNSSTSSVNSVRDRMGESSGGPRTPNTPNMRGASTSESTRSREESKPLS